MPPHLIENIPRNWKKDEWRTLPPYSLWLIKTVREMRIRKLEHIAKFEGLHAILPDDDDGLNYKPRPYA